MHFETPEFYANYYPDEDDSNTLNLWLVLLAFGLTQLKQIPMSVKLLIVAGILLYMGRAEVCDE
ncbi:MAG: hypothetical protein BEN18_10920 [Epulopiscium sp. Nuni2H_MBin001]|nr:MAG: hypothetical protein BEN18_10920 [Epulopiscium sp. Nuni2H_MBin001]